MNKTPEKLDSSTYEGEYKDGLKHGYGTETFADGDKCVGKFKDDFRHGKGTYTWVDGDRYIGDWKDGYGIHTFADGGNTKVNGKKENFIEKVPTHGAAVQSMRVIGKTKKKMATELRHGLMEIST